MNQLRFFHLILLTLMMTAPMSKSAHSEQLAADQILPGPFPTKTTPATPFHFKLEIKLEEPTLIDYPCVLSDSTIATQPQLDPTTGQVVLGPDQKPLVNSVPLAAGFAITGVEGYTLPKGVMVIKDSISNANLTIGRYAYLGDVPRFEPGNLEMFASKMGHTLRVKAWVTQDVIDHYEQTLVLRWQDRYHSFTKKSVHLIPLQNLQTMAAATVSPNLKKLYQTASYYSAHYLDNTDAGMNIYDQGAKEADYENRILTEILRKSLNDNTLTIADGLTLANEYADPEFYKSRTAQSAALFQNHFASRFVSTLIITPPTPPAATPIATPTATPASSPASNPNPSSAVTAASAPAAGSTTPVIAPANAAISANPTPSVTSTPLPTTRLGYLTFVYPIAIDTKGPFGEPSPGLRQFPLAGTIEARWWSDRWQDEFGGFPFLLITDDGVAFHGPITLEGNVWILRRADVSHSCMRMDPSDVLELRELLPKNILSLEANHQTIPLRIMEWPDVDDLNHDGNFEVADVAYYLMQGSGSNIVASANWKPAAVQKYFWDHTFSPYTNLLSSHNTFAVTTTKGTNGLLHFHGEFTGLPKYSVKNNQLVKSGFYTQATPIQTYSFRPTSIIQYREDGISYNQDYHDNSGDNDNGGASAPIRLMHGN